jgi:hypothetical protein
MALRDAGAKLGESVSISIRASADIVVTGTRYEPLKTLLPSEPAAQGEK